MENVHLMSLRATSTSNLEACMGLLDEDDVER